MPSVLHRKTKACGFSGKSGSFPEKILRDISKKGKRIIRVVTCCFFGRLLLGSEDGVVKHLAMRRMARGFVFLFRSTDKFGKYGKVSCKT